ncbi:MAG: hypothetical protein JW819_07120 [Candidatus Krumholzibacteriota bacterium]|nr:hypothetical protein [Candidatus Krumholzibacteriota bacterium]
MRRLIPILLLLVPTAALAADAAAPASDTAAPRPPALFRLDARGPRPLAPPAGPWRVPAARGLAAGPAGRVLLLDDAGGLQALLPADSLTTGGSLAAGGALAPGDSLAVRPFGGDLPAADWPLALAADGGDWLLLPAGGNVLRRLGRRGESLTGVFLPAGETPWRELGTDGSGRIWLLAPDAGRALAVARGGQVLQDWSLERRLPGFRGPLAAWCPDGSGGLLVIAGWPPRAWRLNGAGNVIAPPRLPGDLPSELALAAVDGDFVLATSSGPLSLAPLPGRRLLVLEGPVGRLWVFDSDSGTGAP